MFYYTAGRLILPLLIQCILNSLVQNGLHHGDICMRNCSRAQCAAVSICFERFLDNCQDDFPTAGQLFFAFFHTSLGTAVYTTNKSLQGQRLNLKPELPMKRLLVFIWTCKSVLINADVSLYPCMLYLLMMHVCIETPLHAILPRDGVAVLWVVQKRHVDSDQRRSVPREDLTPDD